MVYVTIEKDANDILECSQPNATYAATVRKTIDAGRYNAIEFGDLLNGLFGEMASQIGPVSIEARNY